MIIILTAPIQSGKTTSLISWSEKRDDVYGILTPVVNGKRVFMNANTKEQFLMEAKADEAETVRIGKFVFSKSSFEKAIQVIRNAIHNKGWLIIDEIGPLELKGEGFAGILKEVLIKRNENILLVVREGLLEQINNHFTINARVISNTDNL